MRSIPFESEKAIALRAEQITEVLEIRTGQWRFVGTEGLPGTDPSKFLELNVARWKEKGLSIEGIRSATRQGETESVIIIQVTSTVISFFFVDRLQAPSETIIRHSRWNPDTRRVVIKQVAPPLGR